MGTAETVLFFILGPVALIGAIGMVLARNAVHSALFLVLTMASLGVFYLIQSGPFIGMVQIIVYTGAIMTLFLFVLMLIGRDSTDSVVETLRGQKVAATVIGIGLAGLLGTALLRGLGTVKPVGLAKWNDNGQNVNNLAYLIFSKYVFAFEVTSALLITAAVGAIILAHVQHGPGEKRTQKQRSQARFAEGVYPAPKPGPGVFARHDSVATPALLPDGSVAEASRNATTKRVAAELGLPTAEQLVASGGDLEGRDGPPEPVEDHEHLHGHAHTGHTGTGRV